RRRVSAAADGRRRSQLELRARGDLQPNGAVLGPDPRHVDAGPPRRGSDAGPGRDLLPDRRRAARAGDLRPLAAPGTVVPRSGTAEARVAERRVRLLW